MEFCEGECVAIVKVLCVKLVALDELVIVLLRERIKTE